MVMCMHDCNVYMYTVYSFSVGILFSFHMLCAVKVNLVKTGNTLTLQHALIYTALPL